MSSEVPGGWRATKLGDHCRIDIGGTPSRDKPQFWSNERDGHPWVSIADLKTPLVNHTKEFISDLGIANSNVKPVPRGTVMMSFKLTIGRTAIAARDLFTNEAIAAFNPSDDLDNDFLFYALPHAASGAETDQAIKGATLNKAKLRDLSILLPPLDEQRRIAEVLRSASAACEAGKQVVETYGDVIQTEIDTVVADLVADPKTPMVRLGDVSTVKGGKRLPKGSEYSDNATGSRYVRVTDWNDYEIDPAHVRWISSEAASSIRRYTISSVDLFISIAGSIGLVASVPAELNGAYLTENAAKIVLREDVEIDREYLLLVMRSGSLTSQIRQQKGVGGGVPKLALFRIEALDIPLPPLGRQREIAASYQSLKVARSNASQALEGAARVFETLAADLLSGRVRVPA